MGIRLIDVKLELHKAVRYLEQIARLFFVK